MKARRTLLVAALVLALAPPASARQDQILRVEGALTAQTYPGLDVFLSNSIDTIVGLDIRADAGGAGLSVSTEGDRFVAYRPGPGSETEIVADGGFGFQRGAVTLEGFCGWTSGGMHPGTGALCRARPPAARGRLSATPVKTLRIERLDPKIRKQD